MKPIDAELLDDAADLVPCESEASHGGSGACNPRSVERDASEPSSTAWATGPSGRRSEGPRLPDPERFGPLAQGPFLRREPRSSREVLSTRQTILVSSFHVSKRRQCYSTDSWPCRARPVSAYGPRFGSFLTLI